MLDPIQHFPYNEFALSTARGQTLCRYYAVEGAATAVLWIGGVGGGWDTPALGLYPRLCQDLCEDGIASLRVRFRKPTILWEALYDLQAAYAFLRRQGMRHFGVVGHSLGAAVALQAASAEAGTHAVICLAPQAYGADAVENLPQDCAALFIHGTADRILPDSCSKSLYNRAPARRRLILLDGADHGLDEVAMDVERAVQDWILANL